MKHDKPKEDSLEKVLEDCKKQSEEYLNCWKRERADFLNYKKAESERVQSLMKFANENIVLRIINVLDDIYLAEKQIPEDLKENNFIKGFVQIKERLLNILKQEGVQQIEAEGKAFDPHLMEAILEEEVLGENSGQVIEEIQKGYKMQDKILRPVKVKITK